jgi:hypothetical protein
VFVIMDDFQNENDGQTDGGKLRKQLEDALKEKKALETQLATLSAQVRAGSVKDLFSELKANPKGVKFYTGEPTKEAVEAWLKGDGDIFATAPEVKEEQGQEGSAGSAPQGQFPPGFTEEMVQAAQLASRMQPTPGTTEGLGDLADKVGRSSMTSDSDMADLKKLWDGIQNASRAAYMERGY